MNMEEEDSEMDQFNVPKIINQNVVKALNILQTKMNRFYAAHAIAIQVEEQMSDYEDVAMLHHYVREALVNLTEMGILACTGAAEYCLQHTLSRKQQLIYDHSQNQLAAKNSLTKPQPEN